MYSELGRNEGSGAKLSALIIQLFCLLLLDDWTGRVTFLCLSVLIYKMGTAMESTSRGFHELPVNQCMHSAENITSHIVCSFLKSSINILINYFCSIKLCGKHQNNISGLHKLLSDKKLKGGSKTS